MKGAPTFTKHCVTLIQVWTNVQLTYFSRITRFENQYFTTNAQLYGAGSYLRHQVCSSSLTEGTSRVLWNTHVHCRLHKTATPISILGQMNPLLKFNTPFRRSCPNTPPATPQKKNSISEVHCDVPKHADYLRQIFAVPRPNPKTGGTTIAGCPCTCHIWRTPPRSTA